MASRLMAGGVQYLRFWGPTPVRGNHSELVYRDN